MHRTLFLILFVLPASATAQVPFSGARATALAGAATGLTDDRRGEANPAAWGHVRRWTALAHATQLYGLPELRYADVLLVAPFHAVRVAMGASTFGFELYRRHAVEIGLGGAAAVGSYRRVHYGARARWHLVSIPGYGRAAAGGFTLGLQLPVTPFITLGVVTHNLVVRGVLRAEMSRRLSVGTSFSPSERFTVTADLNKEVRSPASMAVGVELSPHAAVALRGGVASSPPLVATGIGLRVGPLEVDLAGIRHVHLGWTPSLSGTVTW